MRLALVHPFHWSEVRRGGERYLQDLAWYFSSTGHEVEVLTTVPDRRMTWVERGVTVRAARRIEPPVIKRRGVSAVQTHAASVFRDLARRRYDVVHALTPWGAIAARVARQTVVYTEIGHPSPVVVGGAPEPSTWPHRAGVRAAHVVTALSESSASGIEGLVGRRPVVQAPGVRLDHFGRLDVARSEPATVLFASDAGGWRKSADLLVAAMHDVSLERSDVRLVFGGPGDPADAIVRARLPEGSPLHGRIDVLGAGAPEELPARYARASVTVLPSTHEAFGLVLVESLAAGTPVVCTDAWGMREIVTDEAIGRRFPEGDRAGLAMAIHGALDLAADPATRDRCRVHAARWSWTDVIGPQHEQLYESVMRS